MTTKQKNHPAPQEPSDDMIMSVPKPLNQSQLKNLQSIVDLDFKDLREQLSNELAQQFSRRKSQIEERIATDKQRSETVNAEVVAVINKATDDLNAKLLALASKRGMQWRINADGPMAHFNWKPANLITPAQLDAQAELEKLQAAFTRLKAEVTTTVNREHRKVTRVVLLQGVTAQGAQEIVADLPNPQDILTLVQASTELTHAEDIKLLMGEQSVHALAPGNG